jgi:hypothetical protein
MTFDQHCEESIKLFGSSFPEVHNWLDAFMGTPEYKMRHRRKRHHDAGIKEVIEIFGEEAGKVARQHIISDLKEEGWQESRDPFPQDELHYVKMGLF